MALDAGTVIGKAKLDPSEFIKGADKIKKENDGLSKSLSGVNSNSQRLLSSFGSLAKKSLVLSTAVVAVGTAVATAIGVKAVRSASDMQESMSKFSVTFSTIKKEALAMGKEIEKGWGLSRKASIKMLGDTGDLLKGFGFAEKQALDLSAGVVKLGADLASFSNFSGGAEGATHALSKALLGETEGLKALGVAISVADIERLAKDHGIVGELTRQQKAMFIYKLAVQQSQGAIGDFTRSQGTFANESKISAQRIENIFVGLGEKMIQPVTEIVSKFNGILLRIEPSIIAIGDRVGDFIDYINNVFSQVNFTPVVNALTGAVKIVSKVIGTIGKGAIDFIASAINFASNHLIRFKLYWSKDKTHIELQKRLKQLENNAKRTSVILQNVIMNKEAYARGHKEFERYITEFNKIQGTTLSTSTQTYEEIVSGMGKALAKAEKGVDEFFSEVTGTIGLASTNVFDSLATSIEDVGDKASESTAKVDRLNSSLSESGEVDLEAEGKPKKGSGFSYKGTGIGGFVSKLSGEMEEAGTGNIGDFLSGLDTQELVGVIGEFSSAVGGVVEESVGGLFDLLNLGFENELKMLDKARLDEERALEAQYAGVEGKEEEFQRKKEEIKASYQKKEDDIKRKQFEAEKANKIANVMMSAFQGIAQAWLTAIATTGVAAPVLAPAIAGTLTALILGNTTAQATMIASQEYIPSYAVGGTHSGGMARINERGGELVNLPDGTIIVPNDISRMIASETQEPQQVNYFTINSNQNPELIAQEVSLILARRLTR